VDDRRVPAAVRRKEQGACERHTAARESHVLHLVWRLRLARTLQLEGATCAKALPFALHQSDRIECSADAITGADADQLDRAERQWHAEADVRAFHGDAQEIGANVAHRWPVDRANELVFACDQTDCDLVFDAIPLGRAAPVTDEGRSGVGCAEGECTVEEGDRTADQDLHCVEMPARMTRFKG
jgi:hypothetical protein